MVALTADYEVKKTKPPCGRATAYIPDAWTDHVPTAYGRDDPQNWGV